MRKGFDSLSGIVTIQLQGNVLSGDVFVFFIAVKTRLNFCSKQPSGALCYTRC
ncbi:IS66 Orf2 like protein [Chitinophaga costaii]|uniref:IS66 Orf2 like protein n=2 Tax=Chitinophaga costaii TaxID=1335309 RepID=A0A1C4EQ75_9BACT|nr:IS66 Orf2 like protein [Chitinophaga costaii]